MQSPKDPSQSRTEPGQTEPADPRAGDSKAKPAEFRIVGDDGVSKVVTAEEFKAVIEANREKVNPPAQHMLGSRLVPQWLSGMASMLTEGHAVPGLELYLSAHAFDVNVLSDFALTVDPSFDLERFEKAQEEAGADAVVYDVATRELAELVLRVSVQAMLYAWGRFGGHECLDPHGVIDPHSMSTAGATAMGLCSGVITAASAVLGRTTGERPSISRLAREVSEVISNFEGMPIRQRLGHAWHGWSVDVREDCEGVNDSGRWYVIVTAPIDSKADRVDEYESFSEHGIVTRVAYGADDLEAMANSIEMAQADMREARETQLEAEAEAKGIEARAAIAGSTGEGPSA